MGQFSNVELEDNLYEVPENVALNPKATGLLYNLMLLELEEAHKDYLQLYKKHPVLAKIFPANLEDLDDAILVIKEEKTRTFQELLEELNKEQ